MTSPSLTEAKLALQRGETKSRNLDMLRKHADLAMLCAQLCVAVRTNRPHLTPFTDQLMILSTGVMSACMLVIAAMEMDIAASE